MNTPAAPAAVDSRVPSQLIVALYGDSLLLGGVGRRLAREANLRVVALERLTAVNELSSLAPDVLLVDLGTVPIDSALALLADHPALLLVGLDAGGTRLLVLSGERARTVSTDDLITLINRGRTPGHEGGTS